MYLFVMALHIVVCIFLILIIILQPGKGGDVGAAFGGGSSSSTFGPRGPVGLLQRATTVVAVLFMGTSLTLALYSNRSLQSGTNVKDVLQQLQDEQVEVEEVVEEPVATDVVAVAVEEEPAEVVDDEAAAEDVGDNAP
jgi:preprotein translocase subunit SecG